MKPLVELIYQNFPVTDENSPMAMILKDCHSPFFHFVNRIPVRAMYDYEALEDDELTFNRGDVFEKLEDQDDQGN